MYVVTYTQHLLVAVSTSLMALQLCRQGECMGMALQWLDGYTIIKCTLICKQLKNIVSTEWTTVYDICIPPLVMQTTFRAQVPLHRTTAFNISLA